MPTNLVIMVILVGIVVAFAIALLLGVIKLPPTLWGSKSASQVTPPKKALPRPLAGPVAVSGAVSAVAPAPGVQRPLLGIAYLETTVKGSPLYLPLHRQSITIGRGEDCDIVIDERFTQFESVSRQHAQVIRDNGDYILVDLKSTNGVYVNHARVGRNLLRDGVYVAIGQVPFTFRMNRKEVDL